MKTLKEIHAEASAVASRAYTDPQELQDHVAQLAGLVAELAKHAALHGEVKTSQEPFAG